jgi:hypothetical protein
MNYTKIAFQILVVAILVYKLWKQTKEIEDIGRATQGCDPTR